MWMTENRVRYERKGLRYESDLTDEEYVLIEPFLPPERSVSRRSLVNGIRLSLGCWLMRSGIVTIHLGRTCFAIVARKNGRNCKRKQPSQ